MRLSKRRKLRKNYRRRGRVATMRTMKELVRQSRAGEPKGDSQESTSGTLLDSGSVNSPKPSIKKIYDLPDSLIIDKVSKK